MGQNFFVENKAGYACSIGLVSKSGKSLLGVVSDLISMEIVCSSKIKSMKHNYGSSKRITLFADGSMKKRVLLLKS